MANVNYHADFKENGFFHVINHGVGDVNIFRDTDNYRYFLERYQKHTTELFDTYAYCLMPNHFHLLVRVKSLEELAVLPKYKGNVHKLVMQSVSNWLNGYAKAYNKKYERRGALFLDFTKRIEIDTDTYFMRTVNYIHQNPVHHGFCPKLGDWPYCSYQTCLSDQFTKIKRENILGSFGGKIPFTDFHKTNIARIDPDLEMM